MKQSKLWNVKNVVLMGMFGALAAVLMVFELPLPFIAPSFYGLDLSEIPVLVGTFSMGPLAGVVIELVKVLVKLLIKPTSTGFVGELANFCFGCSMILPAGWIYKVNRTKKGAIIGMAVGTVSMLSLIHILGAGQPGLHSGEPDPGRWDAVYQKPCGLESAFLSDTGLRNGLLCGIL